MAISYTNIWYEKVLKNIRSFLRTEFQGAIDVYIGEYRSAGNESIRLVPVESTLIERSSYGHLREYNVGVYYYYSLRNMHQGAFTEHVLNRVSRIEALFNQNSEKNSASGTDYFEGILEKCTLNDELVDEDENFNGYIVRWDFTCKHLGNIN